MSGTLEENRHRVAMFQASRRGRPGSTSSNLDRRHSRLDLDGPWLALERLLHRFDGFDQLVRVQPDRSPATRAGDDVIDLEPAYRLPHLIRAFRALKPDPMGADASHCGPGRPRYASIAIRAVRPQSLQPVKLN